MIVRYVHLTLSRFVRALTVSVGLILLLVGGVEGQGSPDIPNFWDPQERIIKPNVEDLARLRFLTTTDFPPFSYIDRDKRLTGFHVDLARAICAVLEVMPVCQIQALPFEELEAQLEDKAGEAIIAGLAVSDSTREKFAFSRPYFWLPARFIARKDSTFQEPLIKQLAGREVAIVDGTRHAAMAMAKFGPIRLRLFGSRDAALAALQSGSVAAVFDDGLFLARWLQSNDEAKQCCKLVGGPYFSQDYLGEGMAIAVAKEDRQLKQALNYALRVINDRGTFAELYLRYFPVGLF